MDYRNHNDIPPGNPNPHYPAGVSPTQTATSGRMYRLNATTNRTGLELVVKVMAGDRIDLFGRSYHTNTTTVSNSNSTPLSVLQIAAALLAGPGGALGSKGITASQWELLNSHLLPASFIRGSNNDSSTTHPKAYINYIFLDEHLQFAGGSASRAGAAGTVKDHRSELQHITVPKNGYLFVYVSNESNFNVFFDNLQVVHTRGPLVEETHYYPFGLTMAGISSKAAGGLENKRKFNDGTELENKEFSDGSGLELYATEFRSYDAQIGRFHQIDPLTEFSFNWSGYSFVQNNPILFNDPYGLDTLRRNADGSLPTARVDGSKLQDVDVILGENGQVANYYNGESWQAPKELEGVTVTSSPKKKEEDPASQTPWMDKAVSQLGEKEDKRPGKHNPEIVKFHSTTGKWKNDEVPWCASFVNWCFVQSNIPSLNSARAFDYKNFGVKLNQPAYGAVVIMNYSHVGFVAGKNSDGRIVVLGGNQGDAVNYSPNAVSAVLQYRYPKGFKPNYNLPAFKLRGRSLTGSTSR